MRTKQDWILKESRRKEKISTINRQSNNKCKQKTEIKEKKEEVAVVEEREIPMKNHEKMNSM